MLRGGFLQVTHFWTGSLIEMVVCNNSFVEPQRLSIIFVLLTVLNAFCHISFAVSP